MRTLSLICPTIFPLHIIIFHHNYPLYCVICTVCYEIDKTTLFGACYHASVMIRVNDNIILFCFRTILIISNSSLVSLIHFATCQQPWIPDISNYACSTLFFFSYMYRMRSVYALNQNIHTDDLKLRVLSSCKII